MFEEKMSETIEAGAPSIKYNRGDIRMGGAEGDQQSKQIAAKIWEQMDPQQKIQFQGFEQFYKSGIWKKILQQVQMDQQQEAGQGIASQMPREMMEEKVSMSERVPVRFGGRMRYSGGGNFEAQVQQLMDQGLDRPLAEFLASQGISTELKAQGGRVPAKFGGDMNPRPTPTGNFLSFPGEIMNVGGDQMFDEKSSLKETIDTPKGIETIKEKETMKMAGGGARGWKAQMLAEDWAEERYGREFYDLSHALQMELYGEALDFIDSGGE